MTLERLTFWRTAKVHKSNYIKVNATLTPNVIIAPNNTLTADKLTATGGSVEHNIREDIQVTSGDTYTFSCYLKAAERTEYGLAFDSSKWPNSLNQVIDFSLLVTGH